MLHKNILILFSTLLNFASQRNLPVRITSMIHGRERIVSISSSHSEGRAIDFSVKGWSLRDTIDLKKVLIRKHKKISAISKSDNKVRPVVFHDSGHGFHGHLQCRD